MSSGAVGITAAISEARQAGSTAQFGNIYAGGSSNAPLLLLVGALFGVLIFWAYKKG